jgi:hypothetical protein
MASVTLVLVKPRGPVGEVRRFVIQGLFVIEVLLTRRAGESAQESAHPARGGRFLLRLVPLRLKHRLVPVLLVSVVEGDRLLAGGLVSEFELGCSLRRAPHGAERLTLGTLHLRGIGTMAALEIKVLTDCIVKKAHG